MQPVHEPVFYAWMKEFFSRPNVNLAPIFNFLKNDTNFIGIVDVLSILAIVMKGNPK